MADRYIVDLAGTKKSNFKIADVFAVKTDRLVDTVTDELTGGGALDGDLELGLADSGVGADVYGDAVTIPQITVDVKGRITAVTLFAITAAGIGAAETAHTHTFASLTSKPTTVLGYGITDAVDTADSRLTNSRAPNGSAGGDLTGSFPNPTLATSGVAAGSYGTASLVPVVTVDAKGRITGITTAAVVATPTGLAGGDLTGSFPNPTIAVGAVTNDKLDNDTVTILAGDGLIDGGDVALGDTITINVVFGDASGEVCEGDDVRLTDSRAPSGAAGGVLAGTYPNPTFAAGAIVNVDISASAAIGWAKISKSGAVASDVGAASATHAHAWSDITSGTPTTLAGYGITNAVANTRTVTGITSLAGGGDLSADRTLTLLNDVGSPGNSYYYGTDSGGTKGWFVLPGSTSGAPATAQFLVLAVDATLTVERVLTPSGGIVGADGGAGGAYTLSLTYGSTAGTVCQGNDARLSDARTPSGAAGGDLAGSYPSPTLVSASIVTRLNLLGAAGMAITDSIFALKGSSDPTKIAVFEVDGFTTATTRTFTLPNATGTLPLLGLAQTWSATQTFAAIDATSIGATTRGTGLFTTIGANGQITSTLATGTAPLVIASTTVVANLNASLLLGSTWAIPGTIGSTTPSTGAFTTLTAGQTTITTAASNGIILLRNDVPISTGGASLSFRSDDGSTVMPSGGRLGSFAFLGRRDASNTSTSALFGVYATELWSNTAAGTKITIETTPNGSTTRGVAVTIDQDKSVAIAGSATITGNLTVTTLTSGRIPIVSTAGLLIDSAKLTWVADVLIVGDGLGGSGVSLRLDAATGTRKGVSFYTAGSLRWQNNSGSQTESGANAGSDYEILARTDAGAAIDVPFSIVRAAGGAVTIIRPITATSTLDVALGVKLVSGGTGRVLIGTTSDDGFNRVQIRAADTRGLRVWNTNASASNQGGFLAGGSDDGAAMGSGDRVGGLFVFGATDAASTLTNCGSISVFATEAWGTTATGAKMVFALSANGATARSDRLTIDNDGTIIIASGGVLQLGNAYVGTPQVGTGYVTMKDSTGTSYKVLVAT